MENCGDIWQGDIGLRKIEKIPEGLEKKDNVLALGEITGHKHQFKNDAVCVFKDSKNTQYVKVEQNAVLEHEEHENIEIPKGEYIVIQQREWDVVAGIRQVLD